MIYIQRLHSRHHRTCNFKPCIVYIGSSQVYDNGIQIFGLQLFHQKPDIGIHILLIMIYQALQGRMGSELHALALQTSTPEE